MHIRKKPYTSSVISLLPKLRIKMVFKSTYRVNFLKDQVNNNIDIKRFNKSH